MQREVNTITPSEVMTSLKNWSVRLNLQSFCLKQVKDLSGAAILQYGSVRKVSYYKYVIYREGSSLFEYESLALISPLHVQPFCRIVYMK